jgi:hypothetical protein
MSALIGGKWNKNGINIMLALESEFLYGKNGVPIHGIVRLACKAGLTRRASHRASVSKVISDAAGRECSGQARRFRRIKWQLTTTIKPAMDRVRKLIVPMVTPEAVILWTGLLVIAIIAAVDYAGAAVLPADLRNGFARLNAPIRIAIFGSVGVTLWLAAYAMVARLAARLHYAFDPACEAQRIRKRWVRQLRIGDRLRPTDRGAAIYCTVSGIDSKKGETFEVTWNDGHKNTLSYLDADLFDDVTLEVTGRAARHVRSRVVSEQADLFRPGEPIVLESVDAPDRA